MNTDKLAPHSCENEEAVLGSILQNPDALPGVLRILRPRDFYIERHGWVYEAMQRLSERRDPVDYLPIVTELEAMGKLAECGGAAFITELITSTMHAYNVEGYAHIVRRMSWRRDALTYAGKVARLAHSDNTPIKDIHNQMVDGLNKLGGGVLRGPRTAEDLASQFIDESAEAVRSGVTRRGWTTGFRMLDRLFGGTYGPGGMNVIGGYTNQGKTQIAAEMAMHAARQGPVLYVTLESLPEAIFNRQVASCSGVPLTRVSQRDLAHGDDLTLTTQAATDLAALPLEIESLESLAEIEAYITDMSVRYGFERGMVFVDDMDSLAESMKGGNDYERLKRASVGLLRLTLRTGWGVVALKQLLMPTDANGVTSSARLLEILKPSIMSFEGGRSIVQKGGNVITMLSAEWIKAKVYSDFLNAELSPGFVYFWMHKQRDARSDSVVEVPLRFNAAIPRYEDVIARRQESEF